MARIPLLSGAYSPRSLISSAQASVNLYPETAPQEATPPVPVVQIPTPGLTTFATPAAGVVQCLYRLNNGVLLAVVGGVLYSITITGVVTNRGALSGSVFQFSIIDNGIICVIVDGFVGNGWWMDLATLTLHTIVDPAFYGSTRACFLDGFFIFNRPLTNQFYISPPYWNGTTPFDGTQIASKTGGPDQILSIATVNSNLWLMGSITSEVWFNSGAADFPLERQPGVFVEHGLEATYSVATTDVEVLWLGRDRDGNGIVYQGVQYTAKRVSNHGVEYALSLAARIDDAIAFSYKQEGHTFYVLSLPAANQTWVYDLATGEWHQRIWTNPAGGAEGRHRAICAVFAYEQVFFGDYANGKIYAVSLNVYTDAGAAITRRRAFPHVVKDGKRLSYESFIADMDVSTVGGGSTVSLRWSDDRGSTYGTPVTLTVADSFSSLIVRRLGMARDRVFELSWNFAYKTSLQGAWIEVSKAET